VDKGDLRMRASALFLAKNFIFFEICGVSARTREGMSQCGHFVDKGESSFSRFCADVFYGRPLSSFQCDLRSVF